VLRDGIRLGRALTLDEFVGSSPLHAQARRGEGAAGWTSWRLRVLSVADPRGGDGSIVIKY